MDRRPSIGHPRRVEFSGVSYRQNSSMTGTSAKTREGGARYWVPRLGGLHKSAPSHVRACGAAREAKGQPQRWWIHAWEKGSDPGETHSYQAYKCNSWRCPVCQEQERKILWSRIMTAFQGSDDGEVLLMVLSIPRPASATGEDAVNLYSELSRMWRNLQKKWKRLGFPTGSEWVATVEATRAGWPHINFLVKNKELVRHFEKFKRGAKSWIEGEELSEAAISCGFGKMTASTVYNVEKAANYICKVAGNEVAKLSQLPDFVPGKLRRVRSGKGFLPPRIRGNGFNSGCLVMNDKDFEVKAPVERNLQKKMKETREIIEAVKVIPKNFEVEAEEEKGWVDEWEESLYNTSRELAHIGQAKNFELGRCNQPGKLRKGKYKWKNKSKLGEEKGAVIDLLSGEKGYRRRPPR